MGSVNTGDDAASRIGTRLQVTPPFAATTAVAAPSISNRIPPPATSTGKRDTPPFKATSSSSSPAVHSSASASPSAGASSASASAGTNASGNVNMVPLQLTPCVSTAAVPPAVGVRSPGKVKRAGGTHALACRLTAASMAVFLKLYLCM